MADLGNRVAERQTCSVCGGHGYYPGGESCNLCDYEGKRYVITDRPAPDGPWVPLDKITELIERTPCGSSAPKFRGRILAALPSITKGADQ